MDRLAMWDRLVGEADPWDLVVVGGGATGLGVAVDAASRGLRVALFERHDFGQGTSSRSTKLVHGGVRYLKQGRIGLVRDALYERRLLIRNAPHLVHELGFVVPAYAWWDKPYYGIGLKLYDLLARRGGFSRCRLMNRGDALSAIPTLRNEGLRGGVWYADGQFDDARLLIHLARTACDQGAVVFNHTEVVGLIKNRGRVVGVSVAGPNGVSTEVRARVVVNATGPWTDGLRQMDQAEAAPIIAASQGVHVVLPKRFLPGETAIMVPRTPDGRVMFAIPWHDHAVIGTTDTPLPGVPDDPRPLEDELEMILETSAGYLAETPSMADVLSVFAGVRPLVKSAGSRSTAALSRDHTILVSDAGLVTITGGKWTTYRKMAQDTVDRVLAVGDLRAGPCRTANLPLHGHLDQPTPLTHRSVHGSDAAQIEQLEQENPAWAEPVHSSLPNTMAEVVWAARLELASSVEDVLARRTRLLFLNAVASVEAAPRVAACLAGELGHEPGWVDDEVQRFGAAAASYLPPGRVATGGDPTDDAGG